MRPRSEEGEVMPLTVTMVAMIAVVVVLMIVARGVIVMAVAAELEQTPAGRVVMARAVAVARMVGAVVPVVLVRPAVVGIAIVVLIAGLIAAGP